ncbi:hypothetical protein PQR05_35620 [Paraburkholderia sediminicola]|uniref:Uncharacterized protein n=1 Tax=Paraburkholderia metrosideri TaxID=580937 RepID=A0ABW9E2K5_9BURK
MDDDQVNLEEIADSKRQREAARLAESEKTATTTANEPQGEGNEPAPKQWVKHVTKWLGAKRTLMQARRPLILKKKPAAL